MRKTIRMETSIVDQAKAAAASAGVSLTKFIEDAVLKELSVETSPDDGRPSIPTFLGDGLSADIDLSNNIAVRDLMDGQLADTAPETPQVIPVAELLERRSRNRARLLESDIGVSDPIARLDRKDRLGLDTTAERAWLQED